jgi:uncharacterized cysteine cluster protein YcgN (CxxCxxCC family)
MSFETETDGVRYRSLRLKDDGSCIFFDDKLGRCGVYDYRPLDCRLFPLDITLIDGQYHWICYDCGFREVDEDTVGFAEKTLLPELMPYVSAYAKAEKLKMKSFTVESIGDFKVNLSPIESMR